MRTQPDAFAFSVSQNDWAYYCQCDQCQALAKRENSQMAPVLQLVNHVAAAVEKEFPDKVVETLAYRWTRRVPKTMRPRPNVIIRLCSIECCFAHSLAKCNSEANRKFREDAESWAKLGGRLWVWDYVTDFQHYLLPFPNQRILNDNIQFFIRNNVKGIFEQGTHNTPHSELVELGGYLTAKFLWNPDYDEETAINEFLTGYYKQAADPIRKYIDLIHDQVGDKTHVGIGAKPDSPHLTDKLLIEADNLWQLAEDLVADKPEVLRRVRLSRLSVDYAIMERVKLQPENHQLRILARNRLQQFFETLQSSPLTRFRERAELDKDQYRREIEDKLNTNS